MTKNKKITYVVEFKPRPPPKKGYYCSVNGYFVAEGDTIKEIATYLAVESYKNE